MNILLYAALGATASYAGGDLPSGTFVAPIQVEHAQVTLTRKSVVRVEPMTPVRPIAPQPRRMRFKESGGPKCVDTSQLAGLAIRERDSIDLVLRGGTMVRAKLQKGCGSMDFYSGFYLKRAQDGRICQDRDLLHSRSGGACEIEKFRRLKVEPAK